MDSLPTIEECCTLILEQCQIISKLMEKDKVADNNLIDLTQNALESTKLLIHASNISKRERIKLLNKLDRYLRFKQNYNLMKLLVVNIKDICCQTMEQEHSNSLLEEKYNNFCREKSRVVSYNKTNKEDGNILNSVWSDEIDQEKKKACWFRNHFVGKPYTTFIGPLVEDEKEDLAVISVIKEKTSFRIILRTKQDINMRFIVAESDAKELIIQLEESLGRYHTKLELPIKPTAITPTEFNRRPLRSFSSAIITSMTIHNSSAANHRQARTSTPSISTTATTTRLMRASILFLFQDINFKLFRQLSAETTILSGLEKEFLRYDEIGIPKCYKFGVLNIKEGQTREEEWFSNSGLSTGFEKFLNIIGSPVELKNYKGYAAGLDTKTGESGEISYVASWRDHDIMYHVAPLMPCREHDLQQVHRKRYIGNDIVCIIFMEGGKNQQFDPNSIRSQFLHVFIVVHLEANHPQDTWRVEVLYRSEVKPFSPPLPSPPIFTSGDDLKSFLILKLIHAENSALKSDKFTSPNNKARLGILKACIETGLKASSLPKNSREERPKSAGAVVQQDMSRSVTPELPPVPSISTSNVLRDLKSLTRRKSGEQQSILATRLLNHHQGNKQQRAITNIVEKGEAEVTTGKQDKENNRVVLFETKRPSPPSSTVTTSGIRNKAHHLMNSMIGRRKSKGGLSERRIS